MPEQNNYGNLTNGDLIDLLFNEDEPMTREAVDEFIKRGEMIRKALADIIADEYNWGYDQDSIVAPAIHATYILGSIGGKDAVLPLIRSIRLANEYEYDDVSGNLPSMFGEIGEPAIAPLKALADDKTNDDYVRVDALNALAAITLKNENRKIEIFDYITSFLNDLSESMDLRGLAAGILVDFRLVTYKKSLLEFIEQERILADNDELQGLHFGTEEELLFDLEKEIKDLHWFTRDWLDFYDQDKVEFRIQQKKIENSWWLRKLNDIATWWDIRQFRKKMENDRPATRGELILPSIQLKYFKKDENGRGPTHPELSCAVCGRNNICIGSTAPGVQIGKPQIICEDCAIDDFQKDNKFKSREAAKARRRRMFDVNYLFKEMIVDDYLAARKLKSIDDSSDEEYRQIMDKSEFIWNKYLTAEQKIKLEETAQQSEIEKELRKLVDMAKENKIISWR